ncbi:hypothetical protein [Actinacidiphila soli]|uniref:hypothetical protein n=1 Tax=Actinacidiphila soli TaxID=2487275 RepID=UPI000FCC4583|nr:hypothetical protein [Actinacidiphila soli]
MIGHVEGPEGADDFRNDDLLVSLMRPGGETLLAPPGSFVRIRRDAARRRRVRAAVGGGLVVAAAVAIALPTYLIGIPTTHPPAAPPLVPPAATPTAPPDPRPDSPTPDASAAPRTTKPTSDVTATFPSRGPVPTSKAASSVPSASGTTR